MRSASERGVRDAAVGVVRREIRDVAGFLPRQPAIAQLRQRHRQHRLRRNLRLALHMQMHNLCDATAGSGRPLQTLDQVPFTTSRLLTTCMSSSAGQQLDWGNNLVLFSGGHFPLIIYKGSHLAGHQEAVEDGAGGRLWPAPTPRYCPHERAHK